jgi:small conductance mechanosensitive channel
VIDAMNKLWQSLPDLLPFLATLAVVVVVLWATDRFSRRRTAKLTGEPELGRQLLMVLLTGMGLVLVVLALPGESETRIQVLSLLGIALTAVIALSSTTFVSNAMAGIMLRAMGNFGPGDFISVGGEFGRVSERGLLHTEIQTEDRDLVTLPNFYLMSKTVKVVRRSGTIISATVSIGYDEGHQRVSELLIDAAGVSGLEEPFAQVVKLGDFSVTYRAAGFLRDTKQLISAKSKLRAAILDTLHGAGVEIVSPTFMNQRRIHPETKVVSETTHRRDHGTSDGNSPEALMFDKADLAANIEQLKLERETLQRDITDLEKAIDAATEGEATRMQRGLAFRRARLEAIDAEIQRIDESLKIND